MARSFDVELKSISAEHSFKRIALDQAFNLSRRWCNGGDVAYQREMAKVIAKMYKVNICLSLKENAWNGKVVGFFDIDSDGCCTFSNGDTLHSIGKE